MTTTAQRMKSLAGGNVVRIGHAKICKEIATMPRRDALLRVAEILEFPDELTGRFRVGKLLQAIPSFGRVRVGHYLNLVGLTVASLDRRVSIADKRAVDAYHRPLSESARLRLAGVLRETAYNA